MTAPRIPCAGAVVLNDTGHLLLVRRAHEPSRGLWSLPGGRVEPGETAEEAVVREVWEETGLVVEVIRPVGTVEREAPSGGVYVIDDFACRVIGPANLRPGDDALDARWTGRAELAALPTSPGLWEALAGWIVLPLAP